MPVRRLHIGALVPSAGWETLNAVPLPGIDHVGDARCLPCFDDETFDHVYASHVLEHFDYRDEVDAALSEWYRVLKPGGILEVSVPDLEIVCRLITDKAVSSSQDQWNLMRMIIGGHADEHDYHRSAFTETFLQHFLERNGFVDVERVDSFGYFEDCSTLTYQGTPISLNMRGKKPTAGEQKMKEVSFSIGTSAGEDLPIRYLLDRSRLTQDSIASHILARQLYEPEITIPLMRLLKPGDTFIDIGAHVGYFSVIASRLVGETGHVISIEPDEQNRAMLFRNLELNRCTNVRVIPSCMGDREGEVDLYINSDNDGGHALWNPATHPFNERSRSREIRRPCMMITLDSLLSSAENIPPIRALKIDAEGCEVAILRGGTRSIASHPIPFLFVEINPHALREMATGVPDLFHLLETQGYSGYLVTTEGTDVVSVLKLPPHRLFLNSCVTYNVLFSRLDLEQ